MSPAPVLATSVGMPDFETLVARHQGAVCAVAYAILRDRGRSEEIAQEAFLVAWQKLPGMHPQPSLPGWVCGIARNLARNAARRRRPERSMPEMLHEPTTAANPLDELLSRERLELANLALRELHELEREAVVLYYRGDESLPEVSSALGITTEAAKKRVQRGRAHLKDALAGVASTLRASRPGPAFTAGCIAALAAIGAKSAAAAPVAKVSAAKLVAIGGAAIVAIGVGAFAVARSNPSSSHSSPTTTAALASGSSAVATTSPRLAAARAQQPQIAAAGSSPTTNTAPPATVPSPSMFPELPAADRVFDFAGSPLATPLPPLDEPPAMPFGKRELRAMIAQAQPLLVECVARSGETRKDNLEVIVRVETAFDATVATHARIEGPLASNQALVQCARDALLTISFPGYPSDDVVDIDYPFSL